MVSFSGCTGIDNPVIDFSPLLADNIDMMLSHCFFKALSNRIRYRIFPTGFCRRGQRAFTQSGRSGILLDATTGQPTERASRITIGCPSYSEGTIRHPALCNRRHFSSSLTQPRAVTPSGAFSTPVTLSSSKPRKYAKVSFDGVIAPHQ